MLNQVDLRVVMKWFASCCLQVILAIGGRKATGAASLYWPATWLIGLYSAPHWARSSPLLHHSHLQSESTDLQCACRSCLPGCGPYQRHDLVSSMLAQRHTLHHQCLFGTQPCATIFFLEEVYSFLWWRGGRALLMTIWQYRLFVQSFLCWCTSSSVIVFLHRVQLSAYNIALMSDWYKWPCRRCLAVIACIQNKPT